VDGCNLKLITPRVGNRAPRAVEAIRARLQRACFGVGVVGVFEI
jgi:hypothetical protein